MTTDALAPSLPTSRTAPLRLRRAVVGARREGPVLLTVAMMAVGIVLLAPLSQLTQDGWLTFVGGREIVQHGFHAPDSLTILTQGQRWVDQQWLAQVLVYGLATAGGVKLVMLAHFALLVASFGFALGIARRRGASPLAAAWIGALSLPLSIWGWPMRSQNFAYPLFVAVLGLLVLDRGSPSRRVFWTLPLLVLWSNLHGSVLIGVTLVVLYALVSAGAALRRPDRAPALARCAALATGAGATVFASPYGSSLAGYYHSVLANDDIKLIREWRPAWEYGQSSVFYALVAVALYLVVRHRGRLRTFEMLVLLVTAASGFQAVRNIVWFGYAALVILPVALESTRPFRARPDRPRRPSAALFAPLALAVLAVPAVSALAHDDRWYQQQWSPGAAARVSAALRSEPTTTVWASERFADWLLWKDQRLAGHVAYDARFEMLEHRDFQRIVAFKSAKGPNWHAAVDPYDLVVLRTRRDRTQISALTAGGGGAGTGRPTLYTDEAVTVLGRAPGA